MADENDQLNDEYHFSELEDISPEENAEGEAPEPLKPPQNPTNIRRNAMIAIAIILLLMLGYKLMGYLSMRKNKAASIPTASAPLVPVQTKTTTTTPAVQEPSLITPAPSKPVASKPMVSEGHLSSDRVLQELANLASNQRDLKMGIDPLSGQLNQINNNIGDLGGKLSELTQAINTLASKIERQTDQIESLIAKSRPPRSYVRTSRTYRTTPVYVIQAVIPGRAWLISKNGSTLTVNVGSRIPGYGVVKLIDSRQGKIITSSGRQISFGPQDS